MTAATPPAMQPSGNAANEVEAASVVLRGAPLPVATRIGLWVGVQLVVAGLMIASGAVPAGQALNAAAGWWIVYAGVVDLGTLGVLIWLIRRQGHGISYRGLLGPPAALWHVGLGALAVLAATVPAVVFSTEVTKAFYADATLPMFAMVDVPVWASVVAVLVVPVLTELAEPVAYLSGLLPWLERRIGWLAAAAVVVVWGAEHAFAPFLTTDGGLDLVFAGYRVVSVLPFLAVWTALYYAFGRRLLPIMVARWVFNGGTALAVALNLV